jgi:DNA-binding response OmpR family regulator
MMPVMDGFEMTQQLRQLPQNPIVIAISASVLEVDRQQSFASGCQDLLVKPFQAEELFNKLKDYLDSSWIYDDNPPHQSQAVGENSHSLEVVPSGVVIPPREELMALYTATLGGDIEGIEQILLHLQQLKPEYSAFVMSVLELSEDFRYEELAQLIECYLKIKN